MKNISNELIKTIQIHLSSFYKDKHIIIRKSYYVNILYHISPTYVMIGLSIKPAPRPSKTLAMKISQTVVELYIIYHAIVSGTFTIIMAVLRPKASNEKKKWKNSSLNSLEREYAKIFGQISRLKSFEILKFSISTQVDCKLIASQLKIKHSSHRNQIKMR